MLYTQKIRGIRGGEQSVMEGRKEKEGQNHKELDEESLLDIAIFEEYFLIMHSKYLILKTIFCFCNSK